MEKIIENIRRIDFRLQQELPLNKLSSKVVFIDEKSNVIKEIENVSELDIECDEATYIVFKRSGVASIVQLSGTISCSVKESDNKYKIRCEAMWE